MGQPKPVLLVSSWPVFVQRYSKLPIKPHIDIFCGIHGLGYVDFRAFLKNTYIFITILEKYDFFHIIVNLLYMAVLSVVIKIVTKVIKIVTTQKFTRNRIFINKKRKYRILSNKLYFIK